MKSIEHHDPYIKLRNRDIEMRQIGSMIQQLSIGRDLSDKTLTLKACDYSDPKLGEVHDHLLCRYKEGKPIDSAILIDEILEKAKYSQTSAWRGYKETEVIGMICACIQDGSSIILNEYAEVILKYSEKRRAYDAAKEIARCAFNSSSENLLPQITEIFENFVSGRSIHELEFQNASEIASLRENGALSNFHMIIEGVIPSGGITLFGGETSVGKTYCALDIAIGVASGEKVWGRDVSNSAPVLYFGKDTPYLMLCDRMHQLCLGRGIMPPSNLIFATGEFDDELNISKSSDIRLLERAIKKFDASLVIIDDLSTYAAGVDLNSAGHTSQVMVNLRNIARKTCVSFLVLTLLNKSTSRRSGQMISRIGGSVNIPGKTDMVFVFTSRGSGAGTVRTITPVKNRITEESYSMTFKIEDDSQGGILMVYNHVPTSSDDSTLVDRWVESITNVLMESGDQRWARSELETEVRLKGKHGSPRTIKKAWRIIDENPSVQREKQGRRFIYQWNGVQGEIP